MENTVGSSLEKVAVNELIEKIGAAKVYFLFGEALSQEIVDKFNFSEWKNIFTEAYCEKNEKMLKKSSEKMVILAEKFEELLFVYFNIDDKNVSERAYQKALEIGTSDDWIRRYDLGIFSLCYGSSSEDKKERFLKKVKSIIMEITEI